MSDEKLEFSMADLGRLAFELESKNASPAFQVIYHWLTSQSDDESAHRAIWDTLLAGYLDQRDCC